HTHTHIYPQSHKPPASLCHASFEHKHPVPLPDSFLIWPTYTHTHTPAHTHTTTQHTPTHTTPAHPPHPTTTHHHTHTHTHTPDGGKNHRKEKHVPVAGNELSGALRFLWKRGKASRSER